MRDTLKTNTHGFSKEIKTAPPYPNGMAGDFKTAASAF
jgi:hypothetical protein